MVKLIRAWYIFTLLMAILNFVVGVYTKNIYNVTVAIMDWLIGMSIKELCK